MCTCEISDSNKSCQIEYKKTAHLRSSNLSTRSIEMLYVVYVLTICDSRLNCILAQIHKHTTKKKVK